MQKRENYGVIIPAYAKNMPDRDELSCAFIVATYFRSKIECISSDNANSKSPDFLVKRLNQRWELKTIRGNSANTIHHAFERSNGQSENLIIYLGKTKMHAKSAISRIKRELKNGANKKRILVVTKTGAVVAIKQ